MFSRIALAASMVSTTLALPQGSQPQPANNGFSMIAIHSGNLEVHQHAINAANYSFWIGKPTATYCGSTAEECTEYNGTTTVVSASNEGHAFLPIYTTGFQDLYVDQAGFLKYSEGHADVIPEGGIATPFTYTGYDNGSFGSGSFELPGKDIYACKVSEGVYSIKTDVGRDFCADDCIVIAIEGFGAKSDIYQYV